jgi:hypothetical protein
VLGNEAVWLEYTRKHALSQPEPTRDAPRYLG